MSDFSIPHIPPVRFVKSLLQTDDKKASVQVAFEQIPSLGMLIEAAAQSSSGIKDEDNNGRSGFLVTLKNVKLLQKIQSKNYIVNISVDHKLKDFKSLSFSILEKEEIVATGSLSIILQ